MSLSWGDTVTASGEVKTKGSNTLCGDRDCDDPDPPFVLSPNGTISYNPASRRICGRRTNLANLIAAAAFGHRQHSSCFPFAQTNNVLCYCCQQRLRNSTASACPPHIGRSATSLCHRGPSAKTHSPGVQTTWWVQAKTVTPARATHPNDCSTKIAGAMSRNDFSVTIG